jgi:hypothetical protein
MAFLGKRDLPFIWVTPSGMKIKFALGKVTKKRAGLRFIREGSGVQINIINKDEIDVKKSVVALMPNFIHSLDASNIHEITNYLYNLNIDKIKEDLKIEVSERSGIINENLYQRLKLEYLLENYTYNKNIPLDCSNKDNTFFDLDLINHLDIIKISAFKNNIPLYTIHDCFATTPNNMELIKNNVTLLFSEMYFSEPYIKILHISLLKQILSYEDIFGYPLEFITDKKNDNLIIKDFKKVNIVSDNIIKINLNYLEDLTKRQEIFDNKYYLFTVVDNKKRNLIPLFPSMINDNINKYRKILNLRAGKSTYLIS